MVSKAERPRTFDKYRCREVDGVGGRCQLVIGHGGQHVLERDEVRRGLPATAAAGSLASNGWPHHVMRSFVVAGFSAAPYPSYPDYV